MQFVVKLRCESRALTDQPLHPYVYFHNDLAWHNLHILVRSPRYACRGSADVRAVEALLRCTAPSQRLCPARKRLAASRRRERWRATALRVRLHPRSAPAFGS